MLEAASGKCPHCGDHITQFGIAKSRIGDDPPSLGWPGISIICMSCDKIISVMVDPEHLISRISNEMSSGLKRLEAKL